MSMAIPEKEGRGRIAGRVALITGAASGIGRAAAVLFAREGARVAVADIDEEGAASTVASIASAGGAALAQRLDVTSEADWEAALERVGADWGPPSIVVNCAGIASSGAIAETTLEDWRRTLEVNLDGVFLGTRAAIRAMRGAGRGSIVNVSSISGIKASPGASAYCASKAAVIQLSRVAALECQESGLDIRVNAVVPGGVKTPIWEKTPLWPQIAETDEWKAPPGTVPLKRFAEPEEIARAILFLASDESSYIAGTELVVDGGSLA